MDFFTKYKRPAPVLEHPDPVSKVETQGYIPADVQIMRMIDAGRRLDNFEGKTSISEVKRRWKMISSIPRAPGI